MILDPEPEGPLPSPAARLRAALGGPGIAVVPGCHDAMGARLIAAAGFPAAFLSGYAVSAARLGLPDAGLVSYRELLDAGREVCAATAIPVIGDADTGFGSPINVRRTVMGYHQVGFACVMIEDQVFPKRCGYAQGLEVAPRAEALTRLRAALEARDAIRKAGGDLLVIGRTDSRAAVGLEEALWRAQAFAELGADIVYFEAPASTAEMEALQRVVRGVPTMLAQVEKPGRVFLTPKQAEAIGYRVLLLGVTLLNAVIKAQKDALALIARGEHPGPDRLLAFEELYAAVGFDAYYAMEKRYAE
ncbi:isocitrate lyase/PEP mutase family protein [Falsiroseomonas oryzae]|uniref:isocitrate lyase/PEP mutase family protein n=1 Tax=Falsiroseomonas oryzae TaxID=2766473 RepID=UPI0022EAC045|nr:isocitrate lyase/PEP mutase family protein [Roseomonas sp. MO-31]